MKLKLLLLSFLFILKVQSQIDTIPPVITMNGPDTVTNAVFLSYTDLGATAYDIKDGNVSVTKTGSVDTMHIGVYALTYTARDVAGNYAIPKVRIVIVVDTISPVLTLLGPNPMVICRNQTFTDPGFTASDNYDTVLTISKTGTADIKNYGIYSIGYNATDASGNVSIVARRTIIVVGNCIDGIAYFDKIKNCKNDLAEVNLDQISFLFKNLSTLKTTIIIPDNFGSFGIGTILDTGNYLVKVLPQKPYIKITCSMDSFYYTHTKTSNFFNNVPLLDTLFTDLVTFFTPNPRHRWYITNNLDFYLLNRGTINGSLVKIELKIQNGITILSSVPSYDSIINNKIYWHFDTLETSINKYFGILYKADTSNHMNDTITFQLKASCNAKEIDTTNNYDTLKKRIVLSCDPNEKICGQTAILKPGTIDFNYTVLFQNTGNAEAYDVQVTDSIDSRFDITTLQLTEASHRSRMFIKDNILIVRFEEIYLPDSHANEPKSHGFFSYSLKLKKPLTLNEEIKNTAYIYFDNNQAIVTNTTTNKYVLAGINTKISSTIHVYPNPASSIVNVQNLNNGVITLYDLLGKEVFSTTASSFDVSFLPEGIYILKLNDSYTKLIKE